MTGLLYHLEKGEEFLGRAVRPGRALVVSEESHAQWADRLEHLPIGPHVELLARPFRGRPTIDEWNALMDQALAMRERSAKATRFIRLLRAHGLIDKIDRTHRYLLTDTDPPRSPRYSPPAAPTPSI